MTSAGAVHVARLLTPTGGMERGSEGRGVDNLTAEIRPASPARFPNPIHNRRTTT